MGLVRFEDGERSAVKKPALTPFGRIVLLEDPYLKTGISQWIAHLHLCGLVSGADVWYHTFFAGTLSLGMSFERDKLEAHLGMIYGVEKPGLILGGHPNPAIRGHPKSGQRKRSDFHCCPATQTPLGNGHLLLGASVPKPLGFNAFLPEWRDPPRRSTEAAMNPLEIGFRSWSPLAGFMWPRMAGF
jgi:hypothetical protein